MATNPYSYGSLGQRWTVGEPTSKSLLDVSRVKADANRWALEQLIVDPDDTANFVLTAPGLNIDSNTLYVDSVNNSVGFGLTNPNDYAFNGTPSWVASGGAGNASVIVVSGTTSTGYLAFADGTTGTDRYSGNIQYNHGTNTMSFRTNGDVEAMTINSAQDLAVDGDTLYIDASADRVGINSASPSHTLDVNGSMQIERNGSSPLLRFTDTSSSSRWIGIPDGSSRFAIYGTNGSTEELALDASGNMALGVTPSAWGGSFKALQVKDSVFYNDNGGAWIGSNFYNDGTSNKYINTDYSVVYGHSSGDHVFYTAPSGIAGNTPTFTERMRLTNAGLLGLGTSSPVAQNVLTLQDNTNGYVGIRFNGTGSYAHNWSLYGSGDGAGNEFFGLYDATNGAYRLKVQENGAVEIPNQNAINELTFTGTDFTNVFSQTTSGMQFGTTGAGSYLALYAANAETARVTTDGITFNGDTAAANALDDYEEGTYSVTDQSGAGLSFTVNSSRYVKIGKLVWIGIEIVFPTTSDTNIVYISLPFAQSTAQRASLSCVTNRSDVTVQGYASTGTARLGIIESAASPVSVTNASLSGKYVIIGGVYEAA
jgi:hypothetical protein